VLGMQSVIFRRADTRCWPRLRNQTCSERSGSFAPTIFSNPLVPGTGLLQPQGAANSPGPLAALGALMCSREQGRDSLQFAEVSLLAQITSLGRGFGSTPVHFL
jgi:hypothetical protein